jgi:hypothetical protein
MDHDTVDRSHLGKGEYANYFEVGHDFVAFFVDCGQLGYEHESTKVYSRIITSPLGALRLVGVLAQAVCKYGQQFGAIHDECGVIIEYGNEMKEALCEYVERFVCEAQEDINEARPGER